MEPDTFTNIQPTKATVYIAGKKLDFFSLRLEQTYGEHHSFCIKADIDAWEQLFMSNSKDYFELLGQTVDIDIQQGDDNADTYKFRGIIQDVVVKRQGGKHGYLVLKGASPTILMENGKRYGVFSNLTLKQVVMQLTEDIINQSDRLPVVINPAYMDQIRFLMQYDESDWQFLHRLSCIVKENLYWTGQELFFGMHKDSPISEVTYGIELTYLQLSGRYLPNHFSHYQRLPESDSILKKDAYDKVNSMDNEINMVEQEKSSPAYDTICISGTSKTAHPRIGHLLKVNMPSTACAATEVGTYRITKVIHEFDRNNHYECQFNGIQTDLKYYPFLDVKTPVTEPILVQVISNADPEGQGRVRVKFLFDSDRVSDAWLRVVIPYGVLTDDKKKPIDVIPEAGDQVMVNFLFGDPNLLHVISNAFHQKKSRHRKY